MELPEYSLKFLFILNQFYTQFLVVCFHFYLLNTFLFLSSIQTALANTTPVLVITPNGYETPLNKSGSSVTVITASEIEASGFTTVSEILNTVPGINAVSAGFGGSVSMFARGHDSDMTKIMLDGIDLNDPSAFGTTPVLATLMLNNIEQIEIVLGPQSLIAGADAMGGVINIILLLWIHFD